MSVITKYVGLANGDILAYSIMKGDMYLDVDYYKIDEVVEAISSSLVAPRYRIFMLYADESIAYQINSDDILTGGTYNENYQNGQRRNFSFSLYNENGDYTPNVNMMWPGSRMRLELGIKMADDTIIWFQKGVYVISSISPSKSAEKQIVNVNATDKFSLFEEKTGVLDSTYEIPEGVDIQEVIQDIMLHDSGNKDPFDSRQLIYHKSFKGQTTQVAISKSAGDTFGSILLELATQLSAEIFYNSAGNLTLIPYNEVIQDTDKPLIFEFDSNQGSVININFNFNMNEIINRIIVLGNSNNGAVHRAVAANNDARSPLCVQRIGARTGPVINDSNITTDLLAQERAEYELRKQLILKSSTSVTVIFNPLLEVNNVVTISDDDYLLKHERFLLQGISCSLDYSGQMTMTISNIRNLPFIAR